MAQFVYEPETAAAMFRSNPQKVYLQIRDLRDFFGLTESEVMGELRSGALKAHGIATKHGGYKDVSIRADQFMHWFTSDRPVAEKARKTLNSKAG